LPFKGIEVEPSREGDRSLSDFELSRQTEPPDVVELRQRRIFAVLFSSKAICNLDAWAHIELNSRKLEYLYIF